MFLFPESLLQVNKWTEYDPDLWDKNDTTSGLSILANSVYTKQFKFKIK